nr:MAG TPA: hypothetical protein [Caudoviricetes sp.]
MTYGWARDYALELIHQYSIMGTEIQLSYNNQADYVRRIPKLVDDAQHYIATTKRKIRQIMPLDQLDYVDRGDWREYRLPWNCWQVSSAGLIRYNGPRLQRFHRYHLLGGDRLALPLSMVGEPLSLEYYRLPSRIGDDPPDGAELDNSVDAQQAVPFYVAAHLVMLDNSFAYQALYNEFSDKLSLLGEQPQAEPEVVEDSYDPAEWDYDGY